MLDFILGVFATIILNFINRTVGNFNYKSLQKSLDNL